MQDERDAAHQLKRVQSHTTHSLLLTLTTFYDLQDEWDATHQLARVQPHQGTTSVCGLKLLVYEALSC